MYLGVVDGAMTDEALVDGALVDGALVDEATVDEALVNGALVDEALADEDLSDEGAEVDALAVKVFMGPVVMVLEQPCEDRCNCGQEGTGKYDPKPSGIAYFGMALLQTFSFYGAKEQAWILREKCCGPMKVQCGWLCASELGKPISDC